MIDGLIKHVLDPIWEAAATPLIRAGLTPNQVTLAGLALITVSAAFYLWHHSAIVFGVMLALSFAFDALDGAVARRRGMQSKAGGYLDAVVDRYQELAVLAALAWVHDLWALALAVFSGSVLTSYAKARAALEIAISNDGWPDFFERLERIIFLCALLIGAGLLARFGASVDVVVAAGLAVMAVLTHATALQRFFRAQHMLRAADAANATDAGSGAPQKPGEIDQMGCKGQQER